MEGDSTTIFDVLPVAPDDGLDTLWVYIPTRSHSGTDLKARIHHWLRGRYVVTKVVVKQLIAPHRHRSTVRYLEELLKGSWQRDRPASPHKFMSNDMQALNLWMVTRQSWKEKRPLRRLSFIPFSGIGSKLLRASSISAQRSSD